METLADLVRSAVAKKSAATNVDDPVGRVLDGLIARLKAAKQTRPQVPAPAPSRVVPDRPIPFVPVRRRRRP